MELRHLRYFLAVARNAASRGRPTRLHVTQPTLSHQIKQLEAMVGTTLFERSTKEIELTAAGRLFKPYCERILKEIESSELAISELEGLMRGTLRMAVFHSFSHSMLPPILSEFALRYPGVHVTARLVPRVDMERDLVNAELDFAVAYVSDDNDQIVAERLFDEELVLVVGSKHSHAGRKSMPMRELRHAAAGLAHAGIRRASIRRPVFRRDRIAAARRAGDERDRADHGHHPRLAAGQRAVGRRDRRRHGLAHRAPDRAGAEANRRHSLAAQRPSLGGRVAHGGNDSRRPTAKRWARRGSRQSRRQDEAGIELSGLRHR